MIIANLSASCNIRTISNNMLHNKQIQQSTQNIDKYEYHEYCEKAEYNYLLQLNCVVSLNGQNQTKLQKFKTITKILETKQINC